MRYVYFVRHGESEFNAGGIIKDEHEIALTQKGHEQAQFIAERVSHLEVDSIISSDLLRARQTAAHIAEKTGKSVETSALFRERKYPSSGLGLSLAHPSVQEVERLMIERFGDETYVHSDEELFSELKDRALLALTFLTERTDESVVVVTHGIFLRMLLAVAIFGSEVTGQEAAKIVQRFKTINTGLTLLEYDPSRWGSYAPWGIRVWNDHAHLAD